MLYTWLSDKTKDYENTFVCIITSTHKDFAQLTYFIIATNKA